MLHLNIPQALRLGYALAPPALFAARAVLACVAGRRRSSISQGSTPPVSHEAPASLGRGTLQQQACHERLLHFSSACISSTWCRQWYHTSAAALLSQGGSGGQGLDPRQTLQEAAAAAQQLLGWGRWEYAERALREGIEAGTAALGQDALELAPLFEGLATIAYVEDRVEAARGPAQRAYEIRVHHEGRGSAASALAAVRHAVLLLEALEALGGTQEALKGAMEEALSMLPLGDEVFEAVREGGQEALQRMDADELQRLAAALAARRKAEVCEVGLGESIFYETLAKLAAHRPINAAAVEGAGAYLRFGLEVIQANSSQDVHRPVLDFALREHHRLLERALEAGDSAAADLLSAQYEQLSRVCGIKS